MRLSLKPTNFRTRIALTLVFVIGLLSSVTFYMYTQKVAENIYKSKESLLISMLGLLKDQMYFTINIHDGRVLNQMLQRLGDNENVLNTFLADSAGNIKYPKHYNLIRADSSSLQKKIIPIDKITIKRYNVHAFPFSRAFLPLNNSHHCFKCHGSEKRNLGFVIIDISNKSTEQNLAFTRKFSIIYTVSMVVLIFVFVVLMHYKFVRKSLSKFQETINQINQGDLDERIAIPESEELGKLGKSFNQMIEKFQEMQREVQKYHKKELADSKKMATIGEMAARLAHEIRNPMTGIANAIDIIIDETKDKENIPILEEIKKQTNRVNNAVTDLLKYSRSKDLNIQPGDINSKIRNIIFLIEKQSDTNGIKFKPELQEDIPLFPFDIDQIENVLVNLILNSIRAMSNKGIITLKSTCNFNENNILISVSDEGTGIPESHLFEVFKPFYTTHTEGTGLGLAISNEIIEKHKGEIWAENNKGKGCTFFIRLPIDSDDFTLTK